MQKIKLEGYKKSEKGDRIETIFASLIAKSNNLLKG